MKTIYKNIIIKNFILFFVLNTFQAFGQTPQAFSYQSIIRDKNNAPITETAIKMQISILEGSSDGTPVYTETHTPTTSSNGLISILIGEGATSDDFSAIDWSDGNYFVKIEIDPDGGTDYTLFSTSQLLSVPYALHANTADNVQEADPKFASSTASGITEEDTAAWNAKLEKEIDNDTTNELQTLSISGDTIFLTKGNYVQIEDIINDVLDKLLKKTTYKIGDQAQGGTVIYVTDDGKHGVAMANENLPEKMKWFIARQEVSKLNYYEGEAKQYLNWRLPTVYEVDSMVVKNYEVLEELLNFSGGSYATIQETIKSDGEAYPTAAESYDFDYYGTEYFWYNEAKANPLYIRPVRTF